MKNFIFLMMVFVVFPFIGLIALSAVHQFGGPLLVAPCALLAIYLVILFIDYSQANILD